MDGSSTMPSLEEINTQRENEEHEITTWKKKVNMEPCLQDANGVWIGRVQTRSAGTS